MILFLHLRQFLKYQTRQKENHFNVTLLNFSFLSEAKTCPPLKTEKRKLPGFPLQSFAGWAGIPTSLPVRGPGPISCERYRGLLANHFQATVRSFKKELFTH